ncbi:MAG: hypothetical protein ACI39W_11030 [Brotaphodocola sp.]
MRELSVYYCPQCGRYAYYQLVKNAVCPNCEIKMIWLDMRYQDFMNLGLEERDSLIIQRILDRHTSITGRIVAADRAHNYRAAIGSLSARIQELEAENLQLNETINWMHQTIWELLRKTKDLEHQLEETTQLPHSPDSSHIS